MLPLRRHTILLDACALTSTVFTRVHDAIEIEIESNEFFDCTFATRRIKFNESGDRPDCVSWHILVTVNPCRVPPLLSSHTHVCVECQRTVAYSSIHDEANHALITHQV